MTGRSGASPAHSNTLLLQWATIGMISFFLFFFYVDVCVGGVTTGQERIRAIFPEPIQ